MAPSVPLSRRTSSARVPELWSLGDIQVMKKRAFFLSSLLSALAALVAQIAGFYFILVAIGEAAGRAAVMLPPFIFFQHAQHAPTESHSGITSLLLLSGLVLAVLSLASVIVSFRRGERGWRFISIILLTLYAGTWGILLYDRFASHVA